MAPDVEVGYSYCTLVLYDGRAGFTFLTLNMPEAKNHGKIVSGAKSEACGIKSIRRGGNGKSGTGCVQEVSCEMTWTFVGRDLAEGGTMRRVVTTRGGWSDL